MLDDAKKIRKADYGHVADSIESLPYQIKQVFFESDSIKIPAAYKKVTNVVVSGMGGSNIGIGIFRSIFADQIKVPIQITAGYDVPRHVGKDTLYVLSSFSGNTEETLNCYAKAKKQGAKLMVITGKGGTLEDLMHKDKLPGYVFVPTEDPSNQPRMGIGYSIFGMGMLMSKAGLFKIDYKEAELLIQRMLEWNESLKPESKTSSNPAKQLAKKLYGKIPVLIAGQFLLGNIRTLRNQMNENSKNFATYLEMPDLNHFAMEGLVHPKCIKKDLIMVFFDSDLYDDRIKKRSELTKQVVKKNKVQLISHKLTAATHMKQSFEMLQLGEWVTYYLGILNKVDLVTIPYVDWFKEQLK